MDLWDAIDFKEPSLIACTGAGGKTSVILSLVNGARQRNFPALVSTTTKMFYSQVVDLNPIFTGEFDAGAAFVASHLCRGGIAAWFRRMEGDKVIGLPPKWLDRIAKQKPSSYIIVEADGARGLWLKASEGHEPVIPDCTNITIGILNLKAIGQPLTSDIVHRLDLVLALLQRQKGAITRWQDIATLALHNRGIFQYSQGKKILLLAGGSAEQTNNVKQIVNHLTTYKSGIDKCIVTEGHGALLQPIEVHDL
ncbi:selenium cofactor biosynthesis protein YqeC [Pelosinus sp. IPA-1]|uniref:selenium cofactor biosynthesis protein YqeC n=1 Tax=Pelosinus sp. IPA-1 TaxID=3029569 RepID=UPI0024362BCD|nr:selenium cofactor biosynthesis protein YqeC [Pelosinus sp. IPA-1]GMB00572.1 hydroxylase accessory protein YqeC [Pelosinus sp. IPA-1]